MEISGEFLKMIAEHLHTNFNIVFCETRSGGIIRCGEEVKGKINICRYKTNKYRTQLQDRQINKYGLRLHIRKKQYIRENRHSYI